MITPEGSIISPVLLSIMINDGFSQIQGDIGRSLFADDGALWKRARSVIHIVGKIQEAVNRVEKWSNDWGLKFSIEKKNSLESEE